MLDSQWIANGMADPISKLAQIYSIGDTPKFGSFWAAKMTPFWDHNFSPPCGQLAAPYLCAHEEPGPNSKFSHPEMGPRSCLLSCEPLASPWPSEPPVGMTPSLVILAS